MEKRPKKKNKRHVEDMNYVQQLAFLLDWKACEEYARAYYKKLDSTTSQYLEVSS